MANEYKHGQATKESYSGVRVGLMKRISESDEKMREKTHHLIPA